MLVGVNAPKASIPIAHKFNFRVARCKSEKPRGRRVPWAGAEVLAARFFIESAKVILEAVKLAKKILLEFGICDIFISYAMALHSRNKEEKVIELLEREWAWARLTMRWRLYRSGYHLHARSTWRRAHPLQRDHLIGTTAYQVRQSMKDTLPKNLQSLLDSSEFDREGTINKTMSTLRQSLEAEPQQRRAKHQDENEVAPKSASHTLTGRELAQLHAGETKILAARAQEIGAIAQTSLLRLMVGEDEEALAFQRHQMDELRDELAPPGSRIEERLLAEVIVKARFETLLWQARSADLITTGQTQQVEHLGRTRITRNTGALSDKRAADAEKRYLQALRELTQLRRTLGPTVQVNVANLISDAQAQHPKQNYFTATVIDEKSTK